MNPKARGELSEAKILSVVVERGYAVSLPFGNNQRYDMVLDDGHGLQRVQCKTGRMRNGCVAFSTTSKNSFTGERKSYLGQVDFFLVYSPEQNKVYKVPVSERAQKSEVNLRVESLGRTAPTSTIHWACDYEF